MKHIKQLDAVRGICLILVILAHWVPGHFPRLFGVSTRYLTIFNTGEIALTTFFVMSGFLITRILLNDRKQAEEEGFSKFVIMKNFIIRRTLRIFPAYYFTITLLYIFGSETGTAIREEFVYYLTHTSNIIFFLNQSWDGMASHFWSLAVEEQFYLFWPWVMLFIDKKHLLKTILFFFAFGFLSNYFFMFFIPHPGYTLLAPTCFDAFSAGALLSYLMVYRKDAIEVFEGYLIYAAFICYNVYLFILLFKIHSYIPLRTLITIFTLYILIFSMKQQKGFIYHTFLNNKIFIFLGNISYSMYLFHMAIPYLWGYLFKVLEKNKLNIPLINYKVPDIIYNELILFEMFAVLIIISWLSWRVIEFPINSLKVRFENKPAVANTIQAQTINQIAGNDTV